MRWKANDVGGCIDLVPPQAEYLVFAPSGVVREIKNVLIRCRASANERRDSRHARKPLSWRGIVEIYVGRLAGEWAPDDTTGIGI